MKDKYITKECKKHGLTEYIFVNSEQKYRCVKCRSEAVQKRRDKTKQILIEYKGGKCEICGYNRCISALEFHHLDPMKKILELLQKVIQEILKQIKKKLINVF